MDLSIGKILGNNHFNPSKLPNESDLPSSPSPYPMASNLDDQEPSLQKAMTCSQTEPDFWTMWNERWDLVEPLLSTEGNERWDLVEPLLSTEVESTANRIKPLLVKNEKNEKPERWSITELEAPNFLLSRDVNQIIGGTIPTSFQEILPTESVTSRARHSYCSYKKAQWVVNQKRITTRDEYRKSFQKELRQEGLPYNPDNYYSEWNGWDIFARSSKICPFEKARKIVQKEGIRTLKEYHRVWEEKLEPQGLPYDPHTSKFYKDEWTNTYEFFGKVKGEKRKLSGGTKLEAPNFLLSREVNQIIGGTIPTSFQEILPTESVTSRARDSYCSYKKAQWVVNQKGITTRDEYRASFQKELKSEGLPYNPDNYYSEWNGWDIFFRNREICPFEKARKIVQKEGIRTLNEYHRVWEEKLESEGLPYNPHKSKFYKDEWTNLYDFFGKERGGLSGGREICSFEQARRIVQKEGIRTLNEYHRVWEEKLKSEGLPYNPHLFKGYKDEWTNTYEFFGKVKGEKRE